MIIYKATNCINGKAYIGQTKNLDQRIQEHCYNAKYAKYAFHKALKKYGFENFKWEVLADCESREEANLLEVKFIEEYGGVESTMLYNETAGGHTFKYRSFTEADRKELSERAKKQELWKLGTTPESIAKNVETRKRTGVYNRLKERQQGSGNVSKKQEVRSKIASSVTSLWKDPEYRANQIAKRDKANPIVKCPHCDKEGKKQIMTRWHFDRCRTKTGISC